MIAINTDYINHKTPVHLFKVSIAPRLYGKIEDNTLSLYYNRHLSGELIEVIFDNEFMILPYKGIQKLPDGYIFERVIGDV